MQLINFYELHYFLRSGTIKTVKEQGLYRIGELNGGRLLFFRDDYVVRRRHVFHWVRGRVDGRKEEEMRDCTEWRDEKRGHRKASYFRSVFLGRVIVREMDPRRTREQLDKSFRGMNESLDVMQRREELSPYVVGQLRRKISRLYNAAVKAKEGQP